MRKLDREIDDLVFGPGLRSTPADDRIAPRDAQTRIEHFVAMREVNDDVCFLTHGKSVAVQSRALGRGELDKNVVVIEPDRVIPG